MKKPRRLHGLEELPEALHFTAPRRSFGVVLATIVVAVVFQLSAPPSDATRLIGVLIQGAVVIVALRAAGAQRHVIRVSSVIVVVLFLLAGAAVFGPSDFSEEGPRLITLVLILLTPTAVVAGVIRELREDRTVTIQTVYCGLCLYLLIGTAFAFLFGAIEDLGSESFFAAGIPGTPNDFLYFSLATLTTTGYGDFSAATELGRAMAVTEALIGQMYLVTVLAVIVSNVRRRQPLDGA